MSEHEPVTVKPTTEEIAGAIMGQPTPEDAARNVQMLLPGRSEAQVRAQIARELRDRATERFQQHGGEDQWGLALVDAANRLTEETDAR
ncbi:hypothetical protein PU560_16995 [Georgenia sp. 10Sc9-8]|uniref:Uncharacterized protein n=1 Tax=Georgenia halotolerans TaxID=3028317 RepID=A0ABT5U1F6_9MICO|nr:hypothetical protein [Georgenia halotolerans]